MEKTIRIINSAILTDHGNYDFSSITLDEVKELISGREIVSHITYKGTATLISELLERPVPVHREFWKQKPGETVLVFRLKGKLEKREILGYEDLKKMPCEWGVVTRVEKSTLPVIPGGMGIKIFINPDSGEYNFSFSHAPNNEGATVTEWKETGLDRLFKDIRDAVALRAGTLQDQID